MYVRTISVTLPTAADFPDKVTPKQVATYARLARKALREVWDDAKVSVVCSAHNTLHVVANGETQGPIVREVRGILDSVWTEGDFRA